MSRLIVDTSALDGMLKPSLIDDVMASTRANGECYVCHHDLGAGRVVVEPRDLVDIFGYPIKGLPLLPVAARHEKCTQIHAVGGDDQYTWQEFAFCVGKRPLPVLAINPSVDQHNVVFTDDLLLDAWGREGFVASGQTRIGDEGVGQVVRYPHELSIQVMTQTGRWGFGVDETFDRAVRDWGGLLVSVSFRYDAMDHSFENAVRFLEGGDAVHGWVHLVDHE